jgi:hypothetical protein
VFKSDSLLPVSLKNNKKKLKATIRMVLIAKLITQAILTYKNLFNHPFKTQ